MTRRRETLLAVATALAAALAIASAPWALDQPALNWVFKPLATLAIIALAWGRGDGSGPAQGLSRRWILAGLAASLCGDVALMFPGGFIAGLLSFLLAHLAYLWAFTRVRRLAALAWPFAAYALVAGAILAGLWPGVPAPLRAPVLAYVVCLAAMAAQAAVLWRSGLARGGRLALGGALFVASDALLATNKFAGPLPLSSLWILASYWSAQWLIAAALPPSVSGSGPECAPRQGPPRKP
ncbi:MAG: lysoplasmalogenase [Burkholderiaceae bacterium]|nr:lysoplasmalogenase [Burkholderiaceae bacterium]